MSLAFLILEEGVWAVDSVVEDTPGLIIVGFLYGLIGFTVWTYITAWRQKLIGSRSLLIGAAAWALTAWCLMNTQRMGLAALFMLKVAPDAFGMFICIVALSSLVVLPYPATLFDVRRRRHSVTQLAEASEECATPRTPLGMRGVLLRASVALVILFALWLGCPSAPAYKAAFRAQGYPVTLTELNAWYPQVVEEENIALKYMEIGEKLEKSRFEFFKNVDMRDQLRRGEG
jgi:hypothetical protein